MLMVGSPFSDPPFGDGGEWLRQAHGNCKVTAVRPLRLRHDAPGREALQFLPGEEYA